MEGTGRYVNLKNLTDIDCNGCPYESIKGDYQNAPCMECREEW